MTPSDSPYLIDASGYRGSASRICTPEHEGEVAALMRAATASRTPVTIAGAGTGLTGGRVPLSGWVISLEKLNSIKVEKGRAICGAGAVLRDVQAAARATGQFYAPDPTENGASIGGTIATNASGSRSFYFGATRRHILGLTVVLASGEVLSLRRGEKPPFEVPLVAAPATTKNTAGYYLRENIDYLDLFIGSEGTLGIVTQAELGLLPLPRSLAAGVLFFRSDEAALKALDEWRPLDGLRMLEYLDGTSLALLRPGFPEIPADAQAALLVEREGEADDFVEGDYLDSSWYAASEGDRERFRRLRHALPEVVNAFVRQRGLMKMGSDFAVPIARNREMLRIYRSTLENAFPGRYVIFGHAGDAHLHVNILPGDEAEWQRANLLMTEFARSAVALGGTVSAEHGLGKRKRDFLAIQFSPCRIEKMKSVKRQLDPLWLLGQGTLFDPPVAAR